MGSKEEGGEREVGKEGVEGKMREREKRKRYEWRKRRGRGGG